MAKAKTPLSRREAASKFVPLLQTFHLYGAFGWSDREFGDALALFFKDYQPDPEVEAAQQFAIYDRLTGKSSDN